VLRVRDNGVGIDRDLLPKVFDMFVQGTRSAERTEGGLGLGLAIVKNLVVLHGGSVAARSEGVGKGSEFEIRIPLADPQLIASAPAGAKRIQATRSACSSSTTTKMPRTCSARSSACTVTP